MIEFSRHTEGIFLLLHKKNLLANEPDSELQYKRLSASTIQDPALFDYGFQERITHFEPFVEFLWSIESPKVNKHLFLKAVHGLWSAVLDKEEAKP